MIGGVLVKFGILGGFSCLGGCFAFVIVGLIFVWFYLLEWVDDFGCFWCYGFC